MPTLTIEWQGDLNFKSGPGGPPIELHSSTPGVLSPMHALAYSVMSCMAMDIAHVLGKGRHDLRALTVEFDGERAAEPPRRYTAIHLHFHVTGQIDDAVVERAIRLSHEKYCSVSNSLRQDIDFRTAFTIHRDAQSRAGLVERPMRRVYIDWLRGLAVLFMIEWHSIDSWTVTSARETDLFGILAYIGGWAAPLFLFLAGVSLPLAGDSHVRKGLSLREASWAVQKRGWQIVLFAHLFRLQSFLLNPLGEVGGLFRPDILNILGLGMAVAAFCWGRSRVPWQRAFWLLGPAAFIIIFSPAADTWAWLSRLPPVLEAYVRYKPEAGGFWIFPFAGYVFAGAFVGSLISPARSQPADRAFHLRMGLAGLGVVAIGGVGVFLPPLFANSFYWTTSLSLFLFRCGAMTAALALAWLWMQRPTADHWSPMVIFGRTSLFVYWVHVELAYGFFTHPIQRQLSLPWALTAYAMLTLVMLGLAVLWSRRKTGLFFIPVHMRAA